MNHPYPFRKYSGCGNDFILMDLPTSYNDLNHLAWRLCQRKLGIGADGLIFLEPSKKADFKIHFYNADGSEAEMCGNGVRSAFHYFLKKQGKRRATVETKERILEGTLEEESVKVEMGEVIHIDLCKKIFIDNSPLTLATLNTGVPHALLFAEDIDTFDLNPLGKKVRNHPIFAPQGTNFNLVEITNEGVLLRTYERGVEEETLACGTGATAAAIAAHLLFHLPPPLRVKVKSGNVLTIDFQMVLGEPRNVTMSGPCSEIFSGEVSLSLNS